MQKGVFNHRALETDGFLKIIQILVTKKGMVGNVF